MSALQRFALSAIAILTLTIAGCFVSSTNPLSDPATSTPDDKLFGLWLEKDERETQVWTIGRASNESDAKNVPAGLMRAAATRINNQNEVGTPGSLLFFVTTLGEGTYLNVWDDDLAGKSIKDWKQVKIPGYMVIKYRVVGDSLELWHGNYDRVASVIDKGLVKGEITREKNGSVKTAGLTDTTENLARFMQNGGDKLLYGEKPDRILT